MRRFARGLVISLAACALAFAFGMTTPRTAEAKSATRSLLSEHHAQSRLAPIPKVRRVYRSSSRRIAITGFSSRRWDHRGRAVHRMLPDFDSYVEPHATELFDRLEAESSDPGAPILEELEIEAVLPDFSLDDPSKRIPGLEISVTVVELAPIEDSVEPQPPPIEIDRPTFDKRMIRLHPKLLDSGDDASANS